MRTTLLILAAAVGSSLACNASPPGGRSSTSTDGPPSPGIARSKYAFFTPNDLTSASSTTIPRLVVRGIWRSEASALTDLPRSTGLGIFTWPEMTPVDAVVAGAWEETGDYVIDAQPNSPLSDRWYILAARSMPAVAPLAAGFPAKRLQDGSVGVRFRPGSDPVVQTIDYCAGKRSFVLRLSEIVTTDGTVEARSDVNGESLGCRVDNDLTQQFMAVFLACDRDVPGRVRLSIPKLTSKAGATHAALDHVFVQGDAVEASSGCVAFVP